MNHKLTLGESAKQWETSSQQWGRLGRDSVKK